MVLVDANAHVIADRPERPIFPFDDSTGAGRDFTADQVNAGEDFVAMMDRADVSQALLFSSRFYGFDNAYCALVAAAHPDRFVGIANVNALASSARQQVRYWLDERSMHGVRLWGGATFSDDRALAAWIDDPRVDSLWSFLEENRTPCNAQRTTPPSLEATRRVLERHSGLWLTLSNLAHVSTAEGPTSASVQALLRLAEFPRIFVSCSVDFFASARLPGSAERDVFDALLASFGATRLMWTAFYPSLTSRSYPETVELLHSALSHVERADREQILGGAARSLYPSLRRGV